MKKIILLLIISGFLSSCDNYISTNKDSLQYYVTEIRTTDLKGCVYILDTKHTYINYRNQLKIIDSIGKWNINDTVYLTLNKY